MCEEYNGWTNRETWAVALWINNDQGMQESARDALRTAVQEYADDEYDDGDRLPTISASAAGDVIQAWTEDLFDWDNYGEEHGGQRCVPALMLTMLEDIGSLYRVNWAELGANFLTALAEDDES